MGRRRARRWLPFLVVVLTACGTRPMAPPGAGHLGPGEAAPPPSTGTIPPPVRHTGALPPPSAAPRVETYSVVVNNIPARDLLFALARDAKVNVDIHPGIVGTVTLNAIDQTLHQLLARIARQVDMRWETDGRNLTVMPDTPFLRTYRIDYVNMSRDTSGAVAVTTQIASTGTGSVGTTTAAPGGPGGNNSATEVRNKAQNRFWETLEKNVRDILRETDSIQWERRCQADAASETTQNTATAGSNPSRVGSAVTQSSLRTGETGCGQYREAASVIANPEGGILSIRASSRQHDSIREFLGQVLANARRQVLIEATVAEVSLSDAYLQGIDWSRLRLDTLGLKLIQKATGGLAAPASALMEITYANPGSRLGNISGTVKLLETFGNVKVLSSPKISVLNNQTAVLKVVDNIVYFTVKSDTAQNANNTTTTYTTTVYSVPIGLVMNVTPQISDNDSVLLNIRPSISRRYDWADDPNPVLKEKNITNRIPVIRTREMESMLRVENGNIAVMGGLMEDAVENTDHAVPGVSGIPVVGGFFRNRDDTRRKTELVVFLRPVVIKEASLDGDYASFRDMLPGRDFFAGGGAEETPSRRNIE